MIDLIDKEDVIRIEDLRLSASSLKTFANCGRKFYLSKIAKVEPTHPDNIYTWIGTLVHTSIYYSIADYKDKQWHVHTEPKSIDKVRSFFELLWQSDSTVDIVQELKKDFVLDEDRPNFSSRPVNDSDILVKDISDEEKWKELAWKLVKRGYSLMTNVILEISGIISISLEVPITFQRYGVNFLGYIDIFVETEKGIVFFDLKTSRRPITQPDKDIQFYLYRVGLKDVYGLSYYPLGYYVFLRKGRLYPADTKDSSVFAKMDEKITSLVERIKSSNFDPNIGSPLCRFCEYRGICYNNGVVPDKTSVFDLKGAFLPVQIPEDKPVVNE